VDGRIRGSPAAAYPGACGSGSRKCYEHSRGPFEGVNTPHVTGYYTPGIEYWLTLGSSATITGLPGSLLKNRERSLAYLPDYAELAPLNLAGANQFSQIVGRIAAKLDRIRCCDPVGRHAAIVICALHTRKYPLCDW